MCPEPSTQPVRDPADHGGVKAQEENHGQRDRGGQPAPVSASPCDPDRGHGDRGPGDQGDDLKSQGGDESRRPRVSTPFHVRREAPQLPYFSGDVATEVGHDPHPDCVRPTGRTARPPKEAGPYAAHEQQVEHPRDDR
jgi:hypothetical protein